MASGEARAHKAPTRRGTGTPRPAADASPAGDEQGTTAPERSPTADWNRTKPPQSPREAAPPSEPLSLSTPPRTAVPGVIVEADETRYAVDGDAPPPEWQDAAAHDAPLESRGTRDPIPELGADHYFRQWAEPAPEPAVDDDDLGLDAAFEARARPVLSWLFRRWLRGRVEGVEHVPTEGRALLVCNHSGALPWDGPMLKTALDLEHPRGGLRWLVEDAVFHAPFVGPALGRLGAARACPENAERLLGRNCLVAVFPEGLLGMGKPFERRYQLQRFGRGGYVKLALRTGSPIIPTAIVGAEESSPLLGRADWLGALIGLSYVPLTPTFPWLGPLGLLPLPVRWHIAFGAPVDLSAHGPSAAEDAVLVARLNDEIRARVQQLLDHTRRAIGTATR
ncbi:MAG: 1-acyl-sn-glycerol-3-phosphate acyltransferase [Myxococcota bacterium]|nr:1-acyl-sn-glycerol-3-phosphate acyltransferase [Myxococcota bacterium]MDW8364094.1 1-acyl-sn-glycerol-3-phosphate acyltransferase [Myxococcales bacterium]